MSETISYKSLDMQKTDWELKEIENYKHKIRQLEKEIEEKRIRLVASRDMVRLIEITRKNPDIRHDQEWVALTAKCQRYANNLQPEIVPCLVCCKVSQQDWMPFGRGVESEGLHCAEHKSFFHAVCPFTHNCCEINYHPMKDYEWRKHP